jgi:hypothetical protein
MRRQERLFGIVEIAAAGEGDKGDTFAPVILNQLFDFLVFFVKILPSVNEIFLLALSKAWLTFNFPRHQFYVLKGGLQADRQPN